MGCAGGGRRTGHGVEPSRPHRARRGGRATAKTRGHFAAASRAGTWDRRLCGRSSADDRATRRPRCGDPLDPARPSRPLARDPGARWRVSGNGASSRGGCGCPRRRRRRKRPSPPAQARVPDTVLVSCGRGGEVCRHETRDAAGRGLDDDAIDRIRRGGGAATPGPWEGGRWQAAAARNGSVRRPVAQGMAGRQRPAALKPREDAIRATSLGAE